MSTSENKEALLAEAIQAGKLDSVRTLVEVHGCAVRGPGPWNQVPLARAATYGHIDIIDYLVSTRRGAMADDSTLRAAIEAGKVDVVTHLLDHYDLDWTAREYEFAFAAWHPDMLKFAFRSAIDGNWFGEVYDSETQEQQARIIRAARDAVARLDGGSLLAEILELLRRSRQGGLFCIDHGERTYWFLFDTMENRPNSFPAVWKLAHDYLFEGRRYRELDNYGEKALVDELFRKAITSHKNTAFYVLLQYALPPFRQAIARAVESGNDEIADYLTRCCS